MEYVIGVDLGTSAVKCLLLDRAGNVVKEAGRSFSVMRGAPGYSEQDPDDWVRGTLQALKELTAVEGDVKGISFSGQMHGLVLLDEKGTWPGRRSCGMIHGRRISAVSLKRRQVSLSSCVL